MSEHNPNYTSPLASLKSVDPRTASLLADLTVRGFRLLLQAPHGDQPAKLAVEKAGQGIIFEHPSLHDLHHWHESLIATGGYDGGVGYLLRAFNAQSVNWIAARPCAPLDIAAFEKGDIEGASPPCGKSDSEHNLLTDAQKLHHTNARLAALSIPARVSAEGPVYRLDVVGRSKPQHFFEFDNLIRHLCDTYGFTSTIETNSRAETVKRLGLVCKPEVAAGPAHPIMHFGSGRLVVDTGTYSDKAAVFIRMAEEARPAGAKADPVPTDTLQPGEAILTFASMEQAGSVADALVGLGARFVRDQAIIYGEHLAKVAENLMKSSDLALHAAHNDEGDPDATLQAVIGDWDALRSAIYEFRSRAYVVPGNPANLGDTLTATEVKNVQKQARDAHAAVAEFLGSMKLHPKIAAKKGFTQDNDPGDEAEAR